MKKTNKLHHNRPFLTHCEAEVIDIRPKGIVLDQTVAYAEMGGQLGDAGNIRINAEHSQEHIRFHDTQQGFGRIIYLDDFPTIPVDTAVYHAIAEEDLTKFNVGQKVWVEIDTNKRFAHTVSHSGIHLVLMGLEKLMPGIYHNIKGCRIADSSARLDFSITDKFTSDDIARVEDYVKNIIALDKPMHTFAHKKEPEAWYWQLDDYIIPCGGTHLPSTGAIQNFTVRKKNLGRNAQRIYFDFEPQAPPYEMYNNT